MDTSELTDLSMIELLTTAAPCPYGTSTNQTCLPKPEFKAPYEPWAVVAIVTICSLLMAGTILGNVLVCIAVAIVRKLRTPSNLLIVSLAVSDLLVAVLDMPFALIQEVMGEWVLDQAVCETWTTLDVCLCTASILNLCMISVDRYFVITKPLTYAIKRTPLRMSLMIAFVWCLSAIISIPTLFIGKGDPSPTAGVCVVSQNISYQFYATIGSFYLPLTVMIIIYTRIFLVSSRIATAEARSRPSTPSDHNHLQLCVSPILPTSGSSTPLQTKDSMTTSITVGPVTMTLIDDEENHNGTQQNGSSRGGGEYIPRSVSTVTAGSTMTNGGTSGCISSGSQARFTLLRKPKNNRIASSTERKATKTLGIIMGSFIACWLPFFILALIKPFCTTKSYSCIPDWLSSLFLWLGFANSLLNPIIYARFNRDFRTPFKHILLCRCTEIDSRLRTENFVEQYGRGVASNRSAGTSIAPIY